MASDISAGQDEAWQPPAMHGRVMPSTMRCLHHFWSGSSCERCTDVCPTGAVSAGGSVRIDRAACIDCALCAAVCPTEALLASVNTPGNLYTRIARRIEEHDLDVLYLTCSQTDVDEASDAVFTVPCLGIVPAELWYVLAREHDVRCYLPDGLCLDCQATRGADLMFDRVEAAQAWLGGDIPLEGSWAELDIPENSLGDDRREVLRDVAMRIGQASTGKRTYAQRQAAAKADRLHNLGAVLSAMDATGGTGRKKGPQGPRKVLASCRVMLLNALGHHPDWEPEVVVSAARSTTSCVACGDCVGACPTGARHAEGGRVTTDVRRCVGCGQCIEACAHEGVAMSSADGRELVRGLAQQAERDEEAREKHRQERERRRAVAERRRQERIAHARADAKPAVAGGQGAQDTPEPSEGATPRQDATAADATSAPDVPVTVDAGGGRHADDVIAPPRYAADGTSGGEA